MSDATPEQYKGWIEKYSKEAGVDPKAITALGQHESGWRNILGKTITNPKSKYYGQRATGPLQVMPGNALPGENLRDPETNVRAGIRIFSQGLKASKGDYSKAFGAYYGPDAPPGEETTEQYVKKVSDLYKQGGGEITSSGQQEPTLSYNQALLQGMYAGVQPPGPPDLQPYINYDSVKNLEQSQLINFLKNENVDPSQLKDPMHQISAIMYRWEQIKANVARGQYTPEQQKEIESNFFDRMIVPYQQRTGEKDIRKSDWMNYAYKIHYDLDKVIHQEVGHPGPGGMQGWLGVAQDLFRGTSHAISFLGAILPNSEYNSIDHPLDSRNGSYWDQVETIAEHKHPKLAGFAGSLSRDADYYGLLQGFHPVTGFEGHARSMVIQGIPWIASELIAHVASPAAATGKDIAEVGALGEVAAPTVSKSVEMLLGSKLAGRIASSSLMAARDGFIYNAFTRRNEDTSKAFEDAIEWGAAAALLHLGGAGLGWVGKKAIVGATGPTAQKIAGAAVSGAGKAVDAATSGGGALLNYLKSKGAKKEEEVAEALLKEGEFQEKLRNAGRREADEHEVQQESEQGVSENVAKYGPDGQRKIDNAAAAHILDQEARGLTPEQAKAEERAILEHGTPQERILLDSVNRLRSALGDMKLSEASPELKQEILARLKALTASAQGKLVTNVPALQEALRQRFMAIPLEKLDRSVLGMLLKEVAPKLPPGATQDQVIQAVRKRWAELTVEAAKHAEEKLSEDPLGAAIAANRKRKSGSRAQVFRAVQAKTRRWINKKNEPGVSFSYSPEWKVYAENAVRESGREWTPQGVRDWIKDLSEDDFANDLQAYFIPQFDPDHRLHFERGGSEGKGYDYTNLYGFAWNYRDSMPAEYADRLAEEYINSPKMNDFYESRGARGVNQREAVARKNSLAMWNHVDNFLGSGRFPKEQNVFRSTQSDLDNPTKWMNQLFDEREKKEAAVIDRMYKKDTPANKAAKDTLSIMFKHRRAAYAAGDEAERQKISEGIAEQMVKDSKGGLVDWGLRGDPKDTGETTEPILRAIPNEPWHKSIPVHLVPESFGRLVETPAGAELHLSDEAFWMTEHLHYDRNHPDFDLSRMPLGGALSLDPGPGGIGGNFLARLHNDTMRGTPEKRRMLHELFVKANTVKPGFSVMAMPQSVSPEYYRSTRLEEHVHGVQRWTAQRTDPFANILKHLTPDRYNRFESALQAKVPTLLPYLQNSPVYRGNSRELNLIEAGAKLLTEDPFVYGADLGQAYDGLKEYIKIAKEQHGDAFVNHLAKILGVPKEYLEGK